MWRLRPRGPAGARTSHPRRGRRRWQRRATSLGSASPRASGARGRAAGRALPRRAGPCDATTSRHHTNRYALRRVSWNRRIFSNRASLGSARRLGHELGGRCGVHGLLVTPFGVQLELAGPFVCQSIVGVRPGVVA